MSEGISVLDGNIHATVRAAAASALAAASVMKNVPLTDEERERVAGLVLRCMDLTKLHEVSALDREGVTELARWADAHLDILASMRVMSFVAGVEGKDLGDPRALEVTGAILDKFRRELGEKAGVRWPNLLEMVESHYAGKVRGPTVAVREDGTVVTRWWRGLDFHRDPKEGPASIEERGARRVEEYWVEGRRHRPPEDGPAELITDAIEGKSGRRVEVYWLEGKRHRPHAAGPALILTHYKDNFDLSGEEYFEHGKEHRPARLGPAVTNWDSAGRTVLELFMEEGRLHRDPKEGPASFVIRDAITVKGTSDNLTMTRYCVHGQNHRDEGDGPALLSRDNVSGVAVFEEYWRHGVQHRDGGPAAIDRAPDGGVIGESWFRDGKLHRAPGEGPAAVCRGGGFVFEQWFVDGRLHRDPAEGPAVATHDSVAGTVREEFWVEGARYPAQGPASVKRDRDGKVIEELFWDGEQLGPGPVGSSREAADG